MATQSVPPNPGHSADDAAGSPASAYSRKALLRCLAMASELVQSQPRRWPEMTELLRPYAKAATADTWSPRHASGAPTLRTIGHQPDADIDRLAEQLQLDTAPGVGEEDRDGESKGSWTPSNTGRSRMSLVTEAEALLASFGDEAEGEAEGKTRGRDIGSAEAAAGRGRDSAGAGAGAGAGARRRGNEAEEAYGGKVGEEEEEGEEGWKAGKVTPSGPDQAAGAL